MELTEVTKQLKEKYSDDSTDIVYLELHKDGSGCIKIDNEYDWGITKFQFGNIQELEEHLTDKAELVAKRITQVLENCDTSDQVLYGDRVEVSLEEVGYKIKAILKEYIK